MAISCFSESYDCEVDWSDVADEGIFAFQTIEAEPGVELNMFYDSGCGSSVISQEATKKLQAVGRATNIRPGPMVLHGVNDQKSVCPHGQWGIRLPLKNGEETKISGLVVDEVTLPFPKYPLEVVEEDIRKEVERTDRDLIDRLPKLPKFVGGKVDIMLGRNYMKDFPREITRLKSGLTLYDSMFLGSDGTTGVVLGPHPEFTRVERASHFAVGGTLGYYTEATSRCLGYVDDQIEKSVYDSNSDQFGLDLCIQDELASSNSQLISTLINSSVIVNLMVPLSWGVCWCSTMMSSYM